MTAGTGELDRSAAVSQRSIYRLHDSNYVQSDLGR